VADNVRVEHHDGLAEQRTVLGAAQRQDVDADVSGECRHRKIK